MNAPRTVTLQTIDHGPITIPCPAWCDGHETQPQYRVDTTHFGTITDYDVRTSRGDVTLIETALAQYPYTNRPDATTDPFLWVGLDGDGYPSTPEQLHQIADDLETHAAALRRLADQLPELLQAGEDQ